MKGKILKGILPILIVGAGLVAAKGVGAFAPESGRDGGEARLTSVSVMQVSPEKVPAQVTGNGLVSSAQEITVMPQVSGKIIEVSGQLTPGGRFEKGDVIARIDPRDFRLAVRQQKSQVATAQVNLELEKGRVDVAEKEWALLKNTRQDSDSPLALRIPQLKAAEMSLDAAQALLETRRLSLERSVLKAPFNAMVITENLDVGQVVGPQTQAVRLVGTDRFWVTVSIPVEQLNLVNIPGVNGDEGSRARVIQHLGDGTQIEREGEVLRLAGQLDPQTRRAQLLVGVDNPLQGKDGDLPLLPGAYVDVAIDGRDLNDVFVIPRSAVRKGQEVWVVDGQNALAPRAVAIQWGTEQDVFVTGQLAAGEKLVVSPLSLPIVGQKVQPQDAGKTAAAR